MARSRIMSDPGTGSGRWTGGCPGAGLPAVMNIAPHCCPAGQAMVGTPGSAAAESERLLKPRAGEHVPVAVLGDRLRICGWKPAREGGLEVPLRL